MTRLFVATGFVVAFCAGMMVGLVARHPAPWPPPGAGRASWIASQLGLSVDQAAKMKAIWQDVSHHGGPQQFNRRVAVRRDTDEAVARLVRPEDRAAYDKLMKDGRDRLDALDGENRRGFQQAVEKTKAILTPEQRAKYETLMARPPDGHGPDGHGPDGRPGDGHDGHDDRPASKPAASRD